MILTGELVKLRAVEKSDLDLLYSWENDTDIWKVSNNVLPFSKDSINHFIENERDIYLDKQLRLIIVSLSGNKAVGCIDIFDYDMRNQRAGLGILIANSDDRRNGFAADALEVVIRYSFSTLLLHQLYCHIPSDNHSSIKLFERHGFACTGKQADWVRTEDGWIDNFIYQLIRK